MVRPRLTIATQVVQMLRERLRRGEWEGSLPSEKSLSKQLQVSRETLRAALRQLQREGVVRIAHGRATRIIRSSRRPPAKASASAEKRVIAMITPRPERSASAWYNCLIDEL